MYYPDKIKAQDHPPITNVPPLICMALDRQTPI